MSNNNTINSAGRISPSVSSDSRESVASVPAAGGESVLLPLSDNPYDNRKASTGSTSNATAIPFLHPYAATGAGSSSSTAHPTASSTRLPNPPSLVQYQQMRFLIMDAPSETNLQLYIKEMERYNVSDIVRVCDPSYPREAVERHGIRLHELIFPDGEAPPEPVVGYWLSLIESRFGHPRARHSVDETAQDSTDQHPTPDVTIAIHCVAGLGRAPVLVAIALIESGMSPFDAISFIRERRRGAINTRQLKFLETYRRRGRSTQTKCCIM